MLTTSAVPVPEGLIDTANFDYFVIVDLESTCCNDGSISNGEGEIIEIGAIIARGSDLSLIDSFTTFVKPIHHPMLTGFCSELTSITQQQVDDAPIFTDAAETFRLWLTSYPNHAFCSWGNYDKNHLEKQSEESSILCPIDAPHINLKRYLARYQRIQRMGLQNALKHYGLTFDGTAHRGVDDARNALKLLPLCLGRK